MKHLLTYLCLLLTTIQAQAATWQVGPTRTYTKPSQVMNLVAAGDVVEIDAAEYIGDVGAWTVDNLTIRGVGGRPHLRANGNYAWGKGTWVAAGNNITVENIEFSEASVPDQNGAGIRLDGNGLTVRNCYFHDNENGILTSNSGLGDLLIENSEFEANGYGDGYSHNIYVGRIASFTLRFCYMHHAYIGHNVKSRAASNFIEYNRIMDESSGRSSMLLDLPNGGFSLVIGNLFMQGANAENNRLLTYGVEGLSNTNNKLFVVNNIFVNERFNGNFVTIQAGATQAELTNNIFVGTGNMLTGTATLTTNLSFANASTAGFVNAAAYDYQLLNGAMAIDAGTVPGMADGYPLTPQFTYTHPTMGSPRTSLGLGMDIGAYEYDTPLGLELASFSANELDNKQVMLDWATTSEVDLNYFLLEKSTDTYRWKPLATINAKGIPSSYQIIDQRPSSGINYYRLTVYDEEGTTEFSEIITIKINKDLGGNSLYPNPIALGEVLQFNLGDQETARFQLFDVAGRKRVDFVVGEYAGLPLGVEAGIYFYLLGEERGKLMVK